MAVLSDGPALGSLMFEYHNMALVVWYGINLDQRGQTDLIRLLSVAVTKDNRLVEYHRIKKKYAIDSP